MSEANSGSALTPHRYAIVSDRDRTIMTYDRRHVLAQWGGTLPGGEIWSNSVRLVSTETGANANVPTHEDLEIWCHGDAKDAVAAFIQNSSASMHNAVKLTHLKMNVVDLNGHYTDQNTIEHVYSPTVSPSGGSTCPPNQIALVVSLTTEFSRGPAHRGRFYLPLPTLAPSSTTGLIGTGSAMDVATAAAAFIEALADQPGPDILLGMRVAVMSKKGTGATNVVTGVDVGLVLDTQRRRRAELPENYQHAPVDQGAY